MIKKHIIILIYFCFAFCNLVNGQRTCDAMDHLNELEQKDPSIKIKMDAIEKHTQYILDQASTRTVDGIITIPVVVHVVYNEEGENISDAQIHSQLDVLNEDFRRLNQDKDNLWPQAIDSEIEFCLATQDSYGDATCGITRTYTDSTKFYGKTGMKSTATGGIDGWSYQDYLNIWVCDLSGRLGFATFPGTATDLDGIVCDYQAFGRIGDLKPDFNLGRTATHEVGHWLNLRHIWGDGDCTYDDNVSDTPLSNDHNYGCDIGHISCGSVDMVQNYMDYSDDVCMNLFTSGQKNRMRAQFDVGGFRESLLTSEACSPPIDCNRLFLTIDFDDYPNDISWIISGLNDTIISDAYPNNSQYMNTTIELDFCLPNGSFNFEIADSYGDGLCCNEGNGGYILETEYAIIHDSPGTFGSGEVINFSLNDQYYRFLGPGTAWSEPTNWNKLSVPSACYEKAIWIESDCTLNDTLSLSPNMDLEIKENVRFTISE